MAVMSDADRALTSAELQRLFSRLGLSCGVTKAQLRQIINEVDDWCEANQASMIAVINAEPGGTTLTATQKGWLFDYVVRKRIADLSV